MKPKHNMPKHGKPGRFRKDKWSSGELSVEDVIDRAMDGIDDDRASLNDFFMYAKRHRPDLFRHMSVEQFKAWNDVRLHDLEDTPRPEQSGTLLMANKILVILLQELGGVPDESIPKLIALKNALVEDYTAAPVDNAARLMYEELKAYAALQGLRGDVLTPAARAEVNKIRETCQKQKLDSNGHAF